MPTSNPTPNTTEFKVYDFFPLSPEASPEPSNEQLQRQLEEANMEVAHVKHELFALKAQMLVSVEESVMVAEAHLELRMEQWKEEVEEKLVIKLEKDMDVKLKVELAFVSAFVLFVSVLGGIIFRGLGM